MAVKFSSSALYRRIPNWVSFKASLSSISCAVNFQSASESDQTQSDPPDFKSKIQFLNSKLHSHTLVSILNSIPDLNSAVKLFKWASLQERFSHSTETYQLMILKLGMAGNLEEMEGFCNELVMKNCRGFDKSLLALIDSFVSNHKFTEALRVLYVMNSSNCKPSIEIFNSLMGALVEGKRDFKDVVFVYKEMVKAGVVPNVESLNYLMEALLESGRVDMAVYQYRRMEKKGCEPNVRTFEILVSGLASRCRVAESITILEEMFQSGCEPDLRFYVRIIPLFCELKNRDIGLRLFQLMRASDVAPDCVTHGAVIRCLCEFLNMDEAIKLFQEMKDGGLSPDCLGYMDIINGLCKSNNLAKAKTFLEENEIFDPSCYNLVLRSYCDSGDSCGAKDMFDKMVGSDMVDSESWNVLIQFLCKKSRMDKALELLCRMVISSFLPDPATFSALILGNCNTGKLGDALRLFHYMMSKALVLDPVAYADFVECLCERGDIREADNVYCYMSGKGYALQSSTFSLLIEKICADCSVSKAVKLLSFAQYCHTHPSGATYNRILRGLSELGWENHLWEILSKMIVSGCEFDVETYGIIIQHTSSTNQTGNCISFLSLMLSRDMVPNSDTLACLLSCLAKDSQVHLILGCINEITAKSDILDPAMYNTLIQNLWKEGYKTEASCLLDSMLEKGWVPDAPTHTLLMGSVEGRDAFSKKIAEGGYQDNVSRILDEGLERREHDKFGFCYQIKNAIALM